MKLHLDFPTFELPALEPHHELFAIGSCFGEEMGGRLKAMKASTCVNPFGNVFHPMSVAQQVQRILDGALFTENDVQEHQGRWFSFFCHTLLSQDNKEALLDTLNRTLQIAHKQLQQSDFLLVTFGTNWGYQLVDSKQWVANCQKQAAKLFQKEFPTVEENQEVWTDLLRSLKQFNPKLKVVFTVSPVRHIQDGLTENQRSKSVLHLLVQTLEQAADCHYIPSYELVMDSLRDYRFFDSDLVHINELGKSVVWDWLRDQWFSEDMKVFHRTWLSIHKRESHRPFNPETPEHAKFLAKLQEDKKRFQQTYGGNV